MQTLLHLAPMEGVVDFIMRDFLTQIGGIDQCVTEFIRVTDRVLPDHIFFKYAPELKMASRTRSGVPVFLQFLGSDPGALAENAARAVELGALGVDLNFGCPAKTVNRHDGGAVLLKSPERVMQILSSVRRALPREIPLTAKIRLGYEDPLQSFENVQAVQDSGVQRVTIHCRTKIEGYLPPAHWEWIPRLREISRIPIVANGEIWTCEDFERCREITGCDYFMLGRGAIADPFLFQKIQNREAQSSISKSSESWTNLKGLLVDFFIANENYCSPHFAQARTKQWLRQLAGSCPEAQELFSQIKVITNPSTFRSLLEGGL